MLLPLFQWQKLNGCFAEELSVKALCSRPSADKPCHLFDQVAVIKPPVLTYSGRPLSGKSGKEVRFRDKQIYVLAIQDEAKHRGFVSIPVDDAAALR